jgi:hypothetical protein
LARVLVILHGISVAGGNLVTLDLVWFGSAWKARM